MDKGIQTRLELTQNWLRVRKNSVYAHWLYGLLCGIVASQFFPAGLALLGVFAGDEYWNDKENKARDKKYLPEGCSDWWDAFLVFSITLAVEVVLALANKITIRWWV